MFKKPLAHQSNATPLRSSARRQLLGSLTTQYPDLVPSGENEKEVGKLVLPEGIRTATFETSAGVEGVRNLSPQSSDVITRFRTLWNGKGLTR